MDFGQPNVEIGQKITNGQLLFLVLLCYLAIRVILLVVKHLLFAFIYRDGEKYSSYCYKWRKNAIVIGVLL